MEKLREQLEELLDTLQKKEKTKILDRLAHLISVYPFNEYEFLISSLMGYQMLTVDDYYELRDAYIARNMYLYVFEISAPRGFGEKWAQGHLKGLVPDLEKPTKKIDVNYSGQYDFYLHNKIRIEVKASRAVDFDSDAPLYVKALSSDSSKRFDMNFQQVKPACCDVFVWVGVWRDLIRYWVLSSNEVRDNIFYSNGQHRGNTGEGQIHLKHDNISKFSKYETRSTDLLEAIKKSYERQIGSP